MLHLVFVVLVVAGFFFHWLATLGVKFPATSVAWGCWLAASLIWAL